ncbi:uncharacterized protein LOC121575973 [Coregonus clupeaformis]|uniref:uncharacterized protein LOC121575973 n=1 Tax=Coregonus clupeaformis TaxID=59861 RepID=UPI001E1C5F3D|nr:uncharacterized protein LOC121575973 [Coregonus clupeaformis]
MRNLLTTQNQNCYREQIAKECYTRLAWKSRYGQDYPTSFVSRRAKEQLGLGLRLPKLPLTTTPTTKTILPPMLSTLERRREAVVPMDRSLSEAPLMRAVTPQTKDSLYQGFSKEGRAAASTSTHAPRKAQRRSLTTLYCLPGTTDGDWVTMKETTGLQPMEDQES